MVTITRVKYPKKDNLLEVDYVEPLPGFVTPPENNRVFRNPGAHPKLRKVLDKLRIHFAIMGGWIKPLSIVDIADCDQLVEGQFMVSGFNYFADTVGEESIMITGTHLVMGHPANLNSPNWMLAEDGAKGYVYAVHLNKVIDEINKEVCAYMFENKRGQLALDLTDEKVTKMKIAEPEKTVFGELVNGAGGSMKVEKVDHETGTGGRRGRGRPKKVPQSAAAPGGVIHEETDAEFEDDNAGQGENAVE